MRNGRLKNAWILLPVLLLALAMPVAATAGKTELTTRVPAQYRLTVTVIGGGSVEINGETVAASDYLMLSADVPVTVKATAAPGFTLRSVTYNGKTYQLREGTVTLPALTQDSTLCVTFAKLGSPATGDDAPLALLGTALLISCLGLAVTLPASGKHKKP